MAGPSTPGNLSLDDLKRLGWATESTLSKILADSRGDLTYKLLDAIAKRFEVDTSKLQKSFDEVKKEQKKEDDEERKDRKDKNTPTVKAINDLQKAFKGNFKSLFSSAEGDVHSAFGTFGQTMKYHSEYLKQDSSQLIGLAAGLKLASFAVLGFVELTERLKQVNDAFVKVYASGIQFDGGLGGLTQAAFDSGLSVAAFGEIISKYGAAVSTLGTKRTADLSKRFQEMTGYGGSLLMTQKDSEAALLDTIETMRSGTDISKLSTTQLAERSKNYLEELNDLAIATGRNRDELRKQTLELTQNPLIQTWQRSLNPEAAGKLTDVFARLGAEFGKGGDQLALMLQQVKAGRGSFALVDESVRPLAAVIPGFQKAMQDASLGVENGSITSEQAVKQLSDTISNVSDAQLLRIQAINPAWAATIGSLKAAARQSEQARQAKEKEIQEEARARGVDANVIRMERREEAERQKAISVAFNSSGAAIAKLNAAFSHVAVSLSGVIIPALNGLTYVVMGLADGLNWIAKEFKPLGDLVSRWSGALNGKDGGHAGDVAVGIGALLGGGVIAVILTKVLKSLGGSLFSILGRVVGGIVKAPLAIVGGIFKGLGNALAQLANPKAIAGAAILVGLSASVYLLGKGLQQFNGVDWASLAKAGVAIAAIGVASVAASAAAPEILIGAGAIAGAIALIGLGIGASAWLSGKGLITLTDGLKSFGGIDGSQLISVGKGMGAIALGLGALTASEVVSGIGSLVTGFASLFSADPVSKLKAFAEIGAPLRGAAEAMKFLADTMPDAVRTLSNVRFTDDVIDTLDKLKTVFKTGWFSSGIKAEDLNSGIFVIFQKFADQRDIIQRAVDAINNLNNIDLTGFGKLRELLAMTTSMPGGLITNLSDLLHTPSVMASLQQAIQGSNNQNAQTSTPASPNAAPVITTDELNIKTVAYYEQTVNQFNQMIELMRASLRAELDQNTTNQRGFDDLTNAMMQMGDVIR